MASRGPHPDIIEVPGVGHAPMFMDESQISIVSHFLRVHDAMLSMENYPPDPYFSCAWRIERAWGRIRTFDFVAGREDTGSCPIGFPCQDEENCLRLSMRAFMLLLVGLLVAIALLLRRATCDKACSRITTRYNSPSEIVWLTVVFRR